MKTLIIAEAGVNHNGNIEQALKMVDIASEAGANIVKFQTFKAEELVTTKAQKANYQLKFNPENETQKEMLRNLEISDEMHREIFKRCKIKNIEFLSTAFDPASLKYLLELGIKRIKIPSGEITNFFLLEEAAIANLDIIISTGMCDINDIEIALDTLIRKGIKKNQITLLQCTTSYPASIIDVNLNVISTLSKTFNVNVGLSDHTIGINVPIAATALGATIIEKHFTLDKTQDGPDHKSSLEPAELFSMCQAIREIDLAMGSNKKAPSKNELENIIPVRKSLVAKKNIQKGEIFTKKNVTSKRPGDGITPMRWPEIENKIAKKNYQKDDKIEI